MASDKSNGGTSNPSEGRRRKRRWGEAPPAQSAPAPVVETSASNNPEDARAKALALQASIQARLAALRNKGLQVPTRKEPETINEAAERPQKKARHFELDLTVTAPTFEKVASKPVKKVNPYLAHQEESENADDEIDDRLNRASKERRRNKQMKFVEPGTFVEIAERKRLKAANAEESGFASGRKAGTYFQSANMAEIYGSTVAGQEQDDDTLLAERVEAADKTKLPLVMEWWDMDLLPSKLKKTVAGMEANALNSQALSHLNLDSAKGGKAELEKEEALQLQETCYKQASLSFSKTAALVQHIVPIKPPNANDGPEVQPTLYLTKKERKRQRKLRRQEKHREIQDMQAAGLIPAPEPRLTLKNFIRVLGDQAYLDPSQMEQKVTEQVQARQKAHLERNAAKQLTKEQRAEKIAKKLTEETTEAVHVALFYVKDMSHPYHRAKVELNAKQFNITGGVLECENPSMACVICEGGPKGIKRYTRLMLVRMKWQGLDDDLDDTAEDQDESGIVKHKFNKDNKCELVWSGMASKRFFKGFVFQSCSTSDQARKILKAKGVGQMWDQVLAHASGRGDNFVLKLANGDDDEPGT